MKRKLLLRQTCAQLLFLAIIILSSGAKKAHSQTLAFPGAEGFGRYAPGARGAAVREVYVVTNLNDSGPGSFRDAVSKEGRIITFAVGGIINLASDIVVSRNVTIAGQTAPGDGVVLFGRRVTFSGASNSIVRYLRIRLGATNNSGKDASGLSNGSNMIFDHLSITWGMDEVFSINWDNKGTAPDNITIQNSIIGQGLHRENHSAGGLIQTPDGGKVSLIRNLYISNKTRNPKVKGVNEFVNNVVYNWGNSGNTYGHSVSGDAYIMGGSSGVSEVNIINNYFVGGPLTPASKTTPFSRGTGSFFLYGAGNMFDNNRNGVLDGIEVPYNSTGYPGIDASGFQTNPFPYPAANPVMTAEQAYHWVIANVGASYPRRDEVDKYLADEVQSYGTKGLYVYRETDMPLVNGGLGNVYNAPAPVDTDGDGMPDDWEDANGLDKNNKADAVAFSTTHPEYLNIEVYINSLTSIPAADFIKPPSGITLTAASQEAPPQSTITIKWIDNSDDEDKFIIERSTDGVTFTEITQQPANTTTYTDAGLTPNTTYYYRIKAANSSETSAYSAPVSIKTPPIPTAPSSTSSPFPAAGFKYAELNAGKLTLKWAGSSNTETYSVYFGTNPTSLVKQADIPYAANVSYEITGLNDGTQYYWRVDASNNKGDATGIVWDFRTMPVVAKGLVGYWAFDETVEDGTQITDASSYANHGVLGLDDDDDNIRVPGKVNNALDFATANPNMYVVNIPNQDQLYLGKSSFTLSFWMKAAPSLLPPDNSSSAYLLCKGSITRNASTGATGRRFDIEFKNKQFRFAIDDDNDANGGGKDELQADGTQFFTGEWVYVTTIRNVETKKLQLYLNGSLVKEQNITKALGDIGEASALIIGNIGELEFLAGTNTPAPYKGMLDELKVFNYALSPDEIMAQYYTSPLPIQAYSPVPANTGTANDAQKAAVSWQGGINTNLYKIYLGTTADNLSYIADVEVNTASYQFTGLTKSSTYFWRVDAFGPAGTTQGNVWSFTTAAFPMGVVGDWRLDGTTGTSIVDYSEYLNHGTLENAVDYSWEAGRLNNALNIKAAAPNTAISIPHQEQIKFDKNSFSISFWMKAVPPASSSTSAYILHKGTFAKNTSGGTGRWYGLELKNNQIYFSVDDDITKTTVNMSSASFLTNNWVHVVLIRDMDAKTLKIYKDGVLAASGSDKTANAIGGVQPLIFANNFDLNAPFLGSLDEIKLFNYVLSETEITTLAQAQALPVNLASYRAKAEPNRVQLKWITFSEQNNDRFEVERSLNNSDFKFLLSVKGSGTTNDKNFYTAYDNSPLNGTNYYRLVQYDRDGAAKVLGVEAVSFTLSSSPSVLVYPNPASRQLNIRLPFSQSESIIARLIGLDGREVFKTSIPSSGSDLFTIDLEKKPANGIYILEISGGEFRSTSKIIIE